jgi:hypothetical protein
LPICRPTVIRESRRALELHPSMDVPHLYLAAAYFHLGLLNEAEAEVRAARELKAIRSVAEKLGWGAIAAASRRA